MYYDLSVSEYKLETEPQYIVIMSGNGIPSESGLMRTYYGAEIGKKYSVQPRFIVALWGLETNFG